MAFFFLEVNIISSKIIGKIDIKKSELLYFSLDKLNFKINRKVVQPTY